MKFNTKINKRLESFYLLELDRYKNAFASQNYVLAWHHLERAHIIAQKYPYQHSYVHFRMLQFGFKLKNRKEVFGQIPRLLFGGIKSFVGKIPVGNPGGSNVPPLKAFPIDPEIQEIFRITS
ncbi:DUF3703 domain-containing protein [Flavobacterium agricola]|uniref:DUF3703 domain-containing protein n=1 Tax=Flavobacterium agricola TaxID=2870839 RepID=A0ABY6M056_9FLAO|nr:DUF3703 domain-containing protein [Flavobacterium agricola]UYW01901.1 DUF3703 domain-containing protein [Flavobacterium agricola]